MRALRILVVTTVHHPLDARIWQRQITTLLASGWRVTFAAPFTARGLDAEALVRSVESGGLRTVDLPRATGRRRLKALRAARRVISTLGGGHDLVLLHDPELLVVVGRTRNVVWDVHEDTHAALVAKPWLPAPVRGMVGLAVRGVERWAERRTRLLLAEHGYAQQFTEPHPIIPNAVDVPERTTVPFEPRVVYLGTVTVERGARELAELGRALHPDLTVEVIGPAHGEAWRVLETAADEGHIRWHGFVPSGKALAMLPGAIAGLSLLHDLPNYRHSMPTKLVEYMAHGVPVVTTPLPVAVELVDRAGGEVVPFGDVRAAAEAVLRLWTDQERTRTITDSAYEVALHDYDWGVQGRIFEQTLRNWAVSGD